MQHVELTISHKALHSLIHALGEKPKLSEYEENILKELNKADEWCNESSARDWETKHYWETIE